MGRYAHAVAAMPTGPVPAAAQAPAMLASRNTRTLNAMGFYDDFCVKFDGRWLIKEKRIYRCDDETPLPW